MAIVGGIIVAGAIGTLQDTVAQASLGAIVAATVPSVPDLPPAQLLTGGVYALNGATKEGRAFTSGPGAIGAGAGTQGTSLKWYFINAAAAGSSHMALTTGPAPATATLASTGWTVGTTASGNYSEFLYNTKRAAATFGSTVLPNAAPTTNDCARTQSPYTGYFAAGTWSIKVSFIAGVAATGSGNLRVRVWRSSNPTGSGAVELTTATLALSGVSNLTTSTAQNTSVTWNPGPITLNNEYLFFEMAWNITGASASSTASVEWRTDATNSIITAPAFTSTSVGGAIVTGGTELPTMSQNLIGITQAADILYPVPLPPTQYIQPGANLPIKGGVNVTGALGTLLAGSMAALPTYVGNLAVGEATTSATFGSKVKPGRAIVVIVANQGSSGVTFTGVTDTEGNTYVPVGNGIYDNVTNNTQMQFYVAFNVAGDPVTPNTVSFTTSGSTSALAIYAFEVSGIAAFDNGAGATGSSATAATGAFQVHHGQSIIFAATINSGSGSAATAPFKLIQKTANFADILEYATLGGPGAINAQAALSGSQTWGIVAASFYAPSDTSSINARVAAPAVYTDLPVPLEQIFAGVVPPPPVPVPFQTLYYGLPPPVPDFPILLSQFLMSGEAEGILDSTTIGVGSGVYPLGGLNITGQLGTLYVQASTTPAIAFKQGTSVEQPAGSIASPATTTAFSSSNVAGNAIVVFVLCGMTYPHNGFPGTTVTDTQGNTYNLVQQWDGTASASFGATSMGVYVAFGVKGGSGNQVLCNFTTTNVHEMSAVAVEYSGINAYDAGGADDTSTFGAQLATVDTGSFTTNQVGVILAAASSSAASVSSAGAGYALRLSTSIVATGAEDKVNAAAGTNDATLVFSGTGNWGIIAANFYWSGGSVPTPFNALRPAPSDAALLPMPMALDNGESLGITGAYGAQITTGFGGAGPPPTAVILNNIPLPPTELDLPPFQALDNGESYGITGAFGAQITTGFGQPAQVAVIYDNLLLPPTFPFETPPPQALYAGRPFTVVQTPTLFVQGSSAISFSTVPTLDAAAFPNAQTAGDTIVVFVGTNVKTDIVTGVTDTAGNHYVRGGVQFGSLNNFTVTMYYATNIKAANAGTNVVTASFSPNAVHPEILVAEYSGIGSLYTTVGGESAIATLTLTGASNTPGQIFIGSANSASGLIPQPPANQRVLDGYSDAIYDLMAPSPGTYTITEFGSNAVGLLGIFTPQYSASLNTTAIGGFNSIALGANVIQPPSMLAPALLPPDTRLPPLDYVLAGVAPTTTQAVILQATQAPAAADLPAWERLTSGLYQDASVIGAIARGAGQAAQPPVVIVGPPDARSPWPTTVDELLVGYGQAAQPPVIVKPYLLPPSADLPPLDSVLKGYGQAAQPPVLVEAFLLPPDTLLPPWDRLTSGIYQDASVIGAIARGVGQAAQPPVIIAQPLVAPETQLPPRDQLGSGQAFIGTWDAFTGGFGQAAQPPVIVKPFILPPETQLPPHDYVLTGYGQAAQPPFFVQPVLVPPFADLPPWDRLTSGIYQDASVVGAIARGAGQAGQPPVIVRAVLLPPDTPLPPWERLTSGVYQDASVIGAIARGAGYPAQPPAIIVGPVDPRSPWPTTVDELLTGYGQAAQPPVIVKPDLLPPATDLPPVDTILAGYGQAAEAPFFVRPFLLPPETLLPPKDYIFAGAGQAAQPPVIVYARTIPPETQLPPNDYVLKGYGQPAQPPVIMVGPIDPRAPWPTTTDELLVGYGQPAQPPVILVGPPDARSPWPTTVDELLTGYGQAAQPPAIIKPFLLPPDTPLPEWQRLTAGAMLDAGVIGAISRGAGQAAQPPVIAKQDLLPPFTTLPEWQRLTAGALLDSAVIGAISRGSGQAAQPPVIVKPDLLPPSADLPPLDYSIAGFGQAAQPPVIIYARVVPPDAALPPTDYVIKGFGQAAQPPVIVVGPVDPRSPWPTTVDELLTGYGQAAQPPVIVFARLIPPEAPLPPPQQIEPGAGFPPQPPNITFPVIVPPYTLLPEWQRLTPGAMLDTGVIGAISRGAGAAAQPPVIVKAFVLPPTTVLPEWQRLMNGEQLEDAGVIGAITRGSGFPPQPPVIITGPIDPRPPWPTTVDEILTGYGQPAQPPIIIVGPPDPRSPWPTTTDELLTGYGQAAQPPVIVKAFLLPPAAELPPPYLLIPGANRPVEAQIIEATLLPPDAELPPSQWLTAGSLLNHATVDALTGGFGQPAQPPVILASKLPFVAELPPRLVVLGIGPLVKPTAKIILAFALPPLAELPPFDSIIPGGGVLPPVVTKRRRLSGQEDVFVYDERPIILQLAVQAVMGTLAAPSTLPTASPATPQTADRILVAVGNDAIVRAPAAGWLRTASGGSLGLRASIAGDDGLSYAVLNLGTIVGQIPRRVVAHEIIGRTPKKSGA